MKSLPGIFKQYKANAPATATAVIVLGAVSQVEGVDPNVKFLVMGLFGIVILVLNRLATKNKIRLPDSSCTGVTTVTSFRCDPPR